MSITRRLVRRVLIWRHVGTIPHLKSITGRDGKSYPATKQQALPRDPASIIKQIMRLIEQLDDEDRGKLIDLIDEFYVQKLERM